MTYMPRRGEVEAGEGLLAEGQRIPIDPATKSPLGIYLRLNNISASAFARAIGVAYRTADAWINGEAEISLAAAYEIERITKGVVCMEMWLGMPKPKAQLAAWRAYQPEEIAKAQPTDVVPGGRAHPALESRSAIAKERKKQSPKFAKGRSQERGPSGGSAARFRAMLAEIEEKP